MPKKFVIIKKMLYLCTFKRRTIKSPLEVYHEKRFIVYNNACSLQLCFGRDSCRKDHLFGLLSALVLSGLVFRVSVT